MDDLDAQEEQFKFVLPLKLSIGQAILLMGYQLGVVG